MNHLKCPQEEVLKDYPDAKRILNARARKLMKENEERLAKEMSEQQKQKQKQKAQQHDLKQDEIVELVSSDKVGINVKFVHYFAFSMQFQGFPQMAGFEPRMPGVIRDRFTDCTENFKTVFSVSNELKLETSTCL